MNATHPLRARSRDRSDLLLIVATLALVIFYYLLRADSVGVFNTGRGWAPLTSAPLPPLFHFVASALILAVIPMCLARWLTARTWIELGLGLGRWKEGLIWLAIGIPIAMVAAKVGASSLEMRAVYPLDPTVTPRTLIPYIGLEFLYYGSWEALFRGVLLFGLKDRVGGAAANVIQTALSVTAHFGRPFSETFAAVPAGLMFGWINLRVNSIWYVAIIHWVVGTAVDVVVVMGWW